MGIRQKLNGKRAYFDSNVFIYLMEGFVSFEASLNEIREAILNREVQVFTSELTLCEVLVAPFRDEKAELVLMYKNFIEESGAFQLLPTTKETYFRASLIRAKSRLKTADAIHVATAMNAVCNVFVTNDKAIKLPHGIERIEL